MFTQLNENKWWVCENNPRFCHHKKLSSISFPFLISWARFYQITLIFQPSFTPSFIKSIIDTSWVLSSRSPGNVSQKFYFLFHYFMFTFYFYYYGQIILSGSPGCLVTPENLLQHLHSQILRRNMAQAINIIFIKLLLHISVKI